MLEMELLEKKKQKKGEMKLPEIHFDSRNTEENNSHNET